MRESCFRELFSGYERWLFTGYRGVARNSNTKGKNPVLIDKLALGTPLGVEIF